MPFILLGLIVLVAVGWVAYRQRRHSGSPVSGNATPFLAEPESCETSVLEGFAPRRREAGFFGEWLETRLDGQRVAFRSGPRLVVFVGDFDTEAEPVIDVHLSRLPVGAHRGPRHHQRLESALGPAGQELADRFLLGNPLSADHALRSPRVRWRLLTLSDAVVEVMIYEGGGVRLEMDPAAVRPEELREDIDRALDLDASVGRFAITA